MSLDADSQTVLGLPPKPPSPGESGAPGALPPDARLEAKRAKDKEYQRAHRAKKQGAAPAKPDVPKPDAPKLAADGKPARPLVRFRGENAGLPDVVYVDPCNLETLLHGAAGTVASITKDGRFAIAAGLTMPGTKRSLVADVGHHADVVLAINGLTLTPEQAAYANLLVSAGVVASIISQLPKVSVEDAEKMLPDMQRGIDVALTPLMAAGKGGSH